MKLGNYDHRRSGSLKIVFVAAVSTGLAVTVSNSVHGPRTNAQGPDGNATGQQAHQTSTLARTAQVNDFVHALDDPTRGQLEEALAELKKRSQIDFAIAILNT